VQCADEYADDKGDVLLTAQQGPLQWGLWVNTHKNPRFKLIDFSGLGMTVEIPKQLALASVALRVQVRCSMEVLYHRNSIAGLASHHA
jgi:cancer susceptibility candidate protein 1